MSTFILIIIGYGLLSILCTAVLVATCVIAGRAKHFRAAAKFHQGAAVVNLAESTARKSTIAPVGQRVVDVAGANRPAMVNH